MCVIEWNEDGKTKRYGFISTGILTKQQQKIYTDVTLYKSPTDFKDITKILSF
jgi:polyphosphate kinase